MASSTEYDHVTFRCDVTDCDESYSGVSGDSFKDVWENAKDDGWRCFKNADEEWEHRCPSHRACDKNGEPMRRFRKPASTEEDNF